MIRWLVRIVGLLVLVAAGVGAYVWHGMTHHADVAPYARISPAPARGDVRVTFLGVSTLLFDDGETRIMTDGFFSRPSRRPSIS